MDPDDIQPLEIQEHHDGMGLNDNILIYADPRDEDNGNASHKYCAVITKPNGEEETVTTVQFQHGPRHVEGSAHGMTNEALLAIVLDRMRGFQSSKFACRENAIVITKLEEALMWMGARARNRARRNVLGTLTP